MRKKCTSHKKGIALMLTLLSLALLCMIGFGLIAISTTNARASTYQGNSTKAYYLARVGIADIKTKLEADPDYDLSNEYTCQLEDGSYKISATSYGSGTDDSPKMWTVTSTGEYNGAKRVLTAYLRQETYDYFNYAYFTNSQDSTGNGNGNGNGNGSGTTHYLTGDDSFTGPVHTNDYFTIYGNPVFDGAVTSSNSSVTGNGNGGNGNGNCNCNGNGGGSTDDPYLFWDTTQNAPYYVQGGTTTYDTSQFYHYVTSYDVDAPTAMTENGTASSDFSFEGSVDPKPFPDSFNFQSIRDYHATGNSTITFMADGTIVIQHEGGNSSSSSDDTSNNGNGNGNNKSISKNNGNGNGNSDDDTTDTSGTDTSSSDTTNNGTGNGNGNGGGTLVITPGDTPIIIHASGSNCVIQCETDANGNVIGRIDGQITIGVSGQANIGSSLIYNNKDEDVLAITSTSGHINLLTNPSTNPNVEIDALLVASNSFDATYYDSSSIGTLTIFGGIIENNAGDIGTFDTSTGQTTGGYKKNYVWDSKLATIHPPGMPWLVETSDGTYAIEIVWIKDNSTL